MEYYLIFHLDKFGQNGIVLECMDDLEEMDKFIFLNFRDRQDVIRLYDSKIGEFCLDNMDYIKQENIRNNHDRLGSVSLFCKYQNNYGTFTYKIPIIYRNDKRLLPDEQCIKEIEKSLANDDKLKKLKNEKKYLLSKNELDLINLYFNNHDERRRKEFIYYFINRLVRMNDEKKYFFFRSLMNVCNLNKVDAIDFELFDENTQDAETEVESYSQDGHFSNLVLTKNYEELNKYYDLEKILRDSNIYKK